MYSDDEYIQHGLFDEQIENLTNIDTSIDTNRMKQEMKQIRYYRQIRKKSNMIKQLRGLLRFVLMLALLYFSYRLMTSSRWYLPSNTISSYKIQRIKIVGNKITPTSKIISVISNIELPHKPIYMIKTDEFVQKIKSLSPIKKVYIKRLWNPARIIIFIEEKEPVLTIAPSKDVDPIAFFTREGTLVGHEYMPLDKSYSTYLIITYGNNDDYTKWDKNKILMYEKLAQTLENLSGEKVEYFDMQNSDDVYVKLESVNVRLGEINSKTFKRIKDIKSILKKTNNFYKDVSIQYIDLSWDDSKFIKLGEKENDTQNSDSTVEHQ